MATCMGQELEQHEIIVPALTVGVERVTPGHFSDDRFSPKDRWPRFFLPGPGLDHTPNMERIIPGSASACLIAPGKLIQKIIQGAVSSWILPVDPEVPVAYDEDGDPILERCTWKSIFGDAGLWVGTMMTWR